MKELFIIPLIICLLFFSACTKKENVTPVAKHFPMIDSSRVPDSIVRTQAKVYPYIDTFVGPLYVYYGAGEVIDSTNPAYYFYVLHLSQNLTVFKSSTPFNIQTGYSMSIQDTGRINPNIQVGLNVYSNAISSQLLSNYFSFSWDIEMVAFGVCDIGESKCQYNGVLQ